MKHNLEEIDGWAREYARDTLGFLREFESGSLDWLPPAKAIEPGVLGRKENPPEKWVKDDRNGNVEILLHAFAKAGNPQLIRVILDNYLIREQAIVKAIDMAIDGGKFGTVKFLYEKFGDDMYDKWGLFKKAVQSDRLKTAIYMKSVFDKAKWTPSKEMVDNLVANPKVKNNAAAVKWLREQFTVKSQQRKPDDIENILDKYIARIGQASPPPPVEVKKTILADLKKKGRTSLTWNEFLLGLAMTHYEGLTPEWCVEPLGVAFLNWRPERGVVPYANVKEAIEDIYTDTPGGKVLADSDEDGVKPWAPDIPKKIGQDYANVEEAIEDIYADAPDEVLWT